MPDVHDTSEGASTDLAAGPRPTWLSTASLPQRFLAVFTVATAMLWGIYTLIGISLATDDVLNMVTCVVVAVRRGPRENHMTQWLLLGYGGVVLLPAAVVSGGFGMWLTFAICAFVTTLGWAVCLYVRRQNRQAVRVWLSLPSGQQIQLDTRLFRCGRCRGTCADMHHVAFAPDKTIDLPAEPLTVAVDHAARAAPDVLIAIVMDEDGFHVTSAPQDFAAHQWTGAYSHQWAGAPTACL